MVMTSKKTKPHSFLRNGGSLRSPHGLVVIGFESMPKAIIVPLYYVSKHIEI